MSDTAGPTSPRVRQLRGAREIAAALDRGDRVGLVLVDPHAADTDPDLPRVLERARAAGVPVREASARVLARMTSTGEPASLLALVGRRPEATLAEVLAERGAVWLLVGLAYPTNAGMAIRTAEGSGAAGVVIDADWDHVGKRTAVRASMRADWYMPVLYDKTEAVLDAACAAGHRVFAIENTGGVAPWDVDLRGPSLFLVGGERHGIPDAVLARADAVLRIPMAGFIPSYNVQAAVTAIAVERLRQQGT